MTTQNRCRGFTLLEVLVTLGIVVLVLVLTAGLSSGMQHAAAMQVRQDLLQQDATLAEALLSLQVSSAGDRGSDPAIYLGKDWTDESRASALNWMAGHWILFAVPTLASGTGSSGDVLQVTRVEEVEQKANPALLRYHLKKTTFSRSSSSDALLWNAQNLWCEVDQASSAVSCLESASNPQPVVDHLEAFEVFFLGKTSGWSATRPAAAELSGVGMYLRFKVPAEQLKTCLSYPSKQVRLPAAASVLGIPSRTYQGNQCKAKRLELVKVLHLSSPQVY
ncbi:prepilin-type N-terminal cleavage/methylation domain-containing protein [Deinococcus roseus]|uniref:Prepilin-type N-terminal cleavage/methylation domain-containing protein n=1 Tax=Deinococcus roseus TaxID=392414 RepID=A0ABQ2CTW5_9DEIO|nr:prepilin-type N-terminal cleavage/methylation domain-containing protein [Deinococcus roseus]GGJ19135.1 hypothetical protein GCM10008938_01430 [Deinococcus roseus]